MQLDCEKAMKIIIPAARIAVSNELSKRHKMTQKQIAELLGVEQATVSKYLSHGYSGNIAALESALVRSGKVEELVSGALSGKGVNAGIDKLASDYGIVRAALRLQ